MSNGKRLTRSTSDKWLAGVYSGIANYFDWYPAIVRLVYVYYAFDEGGKEITLIYLDSNSKTSFTRQ